MTAEPPVCYARYMNVSDRELLHHLSRMPFIDTAELAMITGEAQVAVHRGLAAFLFPGIDGLRTKVDFHRRGRFDATITRHDGSSFGWYVRT